VRADAMQDQQDKEPLEATAEAGQVMIDAIVERTAEFVQDMIDGKEVAEIPPFMP
jgi:creatinine amidohydrolase/Fe(II)-dependent formamide hydrolase-like protein